MDRAVLESAALSTPTGADLPAKAYPYHSQLLNSPSGGLPAGLLFDTQSFAVMSITQPPDSQTPDLNADKDGDRVLILMQGDLALQIGENRFRLGPGDAVKIPRGVHFGKSRSEGGAHLLMIRAKPMRSFSMYR
jgi:quercetin dioxygenase-like cupin family protein